MIRRPAGFVRSFCVGVVALVASPVLAGVTVDQYAPLRLKTTETLRVEISDVRAPLSRTGDANPSCDLDVTVVDADGNTAQRSSLRIEPSRSTAATFQPTVDGRYRVTIGNTPGSTDPRCRSRDLRAALQVVETSSGDTEYAIRAGIDFANFNQTVLRDPAR